MPGLTGPLFANADMQFLINICITGLTTGFLYALIALGYTMVYGIVELVNFAHGDLFMLGCFLALTISTAIGSPFVAIAVMLLVVPICCAGLNMMVDLSVYKALRNAPKLAPLVSAIGVSFVFMNIGLFWGGSQDVNFTVPYAQTLYGKGSATGMGEDSLINFTTTELLVIVVTVLVMIGLTGFVKFTSLGKAMRATAQNPTAAQLMGINVNRVIAATFGIGGALAGVASVMYCMMIKTVNYQMGFQNGLYAFTAAVLGGIGNIPGAVLGGLIIGMVYSITNSIDGGGKWATTMVFVILILILVFRPTGLLGSRLREKV